MQQRQTKKDRAITVQELYPELTVAELRSAEAKLELYVAAVLRIVDRLRHESSVSPQSRVLTPEADDAAMSGERSITKNTFSLK